MTARATASARADRALVLLASVLGTLPVALFGAACVARFLPVSADTRFALAYLAVVPFWVVGMCFAFLARRGWMVLALCLVVAALLAALCYDVPHAASAIDPGTSIPRHRFTSGMVPKSVLSAARSQIARARSCNSHGSSSVGNPSLRPPT